jgi:peptidyl-prolyl cis-trans isomerase C
VSGDADAGTAASCAAAAGGAATGAGAAVNGVAVDAGEFPSVEAAAVRELLRQRALAEGLVAPGAAAGEVEGAIERLLERDVRVPEPTEEECRRYYDAHPHTFVVGELAAVRHILFQVTARTPVPALRARAEGVLAEVLGAPDRFEALASEWSNCPSAQHGGNLGQMQRGEMVPEFEQAVFGEAWTGIRRELVKTRFGFHIVAVEHRAAGTKLPFEQVRERIAARLAEAVLARALAQYVRVAAGAADVRGVDLGASATPLVQ